MYFFLFQLLENAKTILSRWATGKQVVGWIWPPGYRLATPTARSPGKSSAFSLHWYKNVSIFLAPSVSVSLSRPRAPSSPPAPPQRPPQLSQQSLGHRGPERPPPATPASPPQLHFCSFYSFAQICLCGKFTARTACLNYLKAQYSRLRHKAFPFCVFYFSV